MPLFTAFLTVFLTLMGLLVQHVHSWPLGLYYDDVCDLRARSVWRTPILDACLVMTNVMGPSFIAVKGDVGDGLAWDKDYELCLYDKKPDCFRDNFINCFPVGSNTTGCTRLHSGTHVIRFRTIPKNHTNALHSQGTDDLD